jgi:hypothetical protein
MIYKYLGLIFQAAKSCRMDNAIPISLKAVSVFTFRLRIKSPPALLR